MLELSLNQEVVFSGFVFPDLHISGNAACIHTVERIAVNIIGGTWRLQGENIWKSNIKINY
jgi:hypothetical protein